LSAAKKKQFENEFFLCSLRGRFAENTVKMVSFAKRAYFCRWLGEF